MKKFVFVLLTLTFPMIIFANDNLQVAKEFMMNLSTGNFTSAESMYDEAMMAALPLSKTEAIWNQVESQVGKFQSIEGVKISNVENYTVFVFTVKFSSASLDVTVTIDQNSKVAGLFLKMPHLLIQSLLT